MIARLRIVARGLVQGVGFRPAIALAARKRGLSGSVRNLRNGALVEVQGEEGAVLAFRNDFPSLLPSAASLDSLDCAEAEPIPGERAFEVASSGTEGPSRFSVPPDMALCPDCLREFLDPSDRRHLYPFISCGSCGPRYTYMSELPYDRAATSMAAFPPCPECRAEYEDPSDRRYRIEGISCPECGPRVEGLEEGIAALRSGLVAAIKGIGGFHLACLADEEGPVELLRSRKARPRKPLAVMYPSLAALEEAALLSDDERAALASPEAPIVLVSKRRFCAPPAEGVAPHNASIGVMIPYSPLHLLVLREIGRPLVMTSANLPGDPLVIDDRAAREGLGGIADAIIGHDRKIHRRADDGVALVCAGATMSLRRGRGSAPRPIKLPEPCPVPILAVGSELKSTVSVAIGEDLATSPHIGDLEGLASYEHFRKTVGGMLDWYGVEPALVACDLHPGYESTRFAEEFARARGIPLVRVQHHHAHLLAAALDGGVLGPGAEGGAEGLLGLILDGTGYGSDGTIWGGEIILARGSSFERRGHLSAVPLPGGEAAIREPWRIAAGLGLLSRIPAGRSERDVEAAARAALDPAVSPPSSSCGRLFDAAAAILGFDGLVTFEGEAAMWLEALASGTSAAEAAARGGAASGRSAASGRGAAFGRGAAAALPPPYDLDGRALLASLAERARGIRSAGSDRALDEARGLALGFHLALAEGLAGAAAREALGIGLRELYLSGGVFQNRIFVEAFVEAIRRRGVEPRLGSRVSVNDAGISVGQAAAGILAVREGIVCA
jgi:hydrogenase maturation protein HypF